LGQNQTSDITLGGHPGVAAHEANQITALLETGNIQLNAPLVHPSGGGGLSINNSASCSLKTSNLKYHLMRDLL